ncbi:alpha/beta hydrolase family protein [Sphingomonas colocasiae]|uniref:S9 family peptidase n=1 Tax=Sphingomonas colocasiae TaxID=1848973 RepID=A0ABS7PX97_9SPHN|nr:alpha/beta hydrolase [Sphingomonas colocasiae]MBY8825589.1 S9 family peptidase [Sphingomonas colocasiae]
MYEPFPGNYVWNLSVNICIGMGGAMGEMDRANEAVRGIAREGEDKGTEAFFTAWGAMADRLAMLGDEAMAAGHRLSACEKYKRATAYYVTAERMQSRDYAPRKTMYATMLATMDKAIAAGLPAERVEIAYEGTSYPGLFVPGQGEGPWPCMVFCNGLDSVKEMIVLCMRDEFAKRGIAMLAIDHPGVGEALRLKGLTAIHDSERWAGAAIDYLETRGDVDADRIGMMGWSLGGYYAPRAACYEKRFKLCVSWGANHNWGELQARRLQREGDRPVPHYWDHVMWVWGQPDMQTFMAYVPRITLNGHLDRMTVPYLITHGANDRQIPIEYAHQSHDQASNSPDLELKFFTDREGGVEHVSADNMEPSSSYICDWVAVRL